MTQVPLGNEGQPYGHPEGSQDSMEREGVLGGDLAEGGCLMSSKITFSCFSAKILAQAYPSFSFTYFSRY